MDFDLDEYNEEYNEQWDDVETVHPRDLEADSLWRRIPVGRKITLTVNGVEKYLLELTRTEVEVVADRIVEELYKNKKIPKDIDLSLIPPKDLLGLFLRPDIVRCLGEHINANISGDEVNKQDLLSFMQIVYTISMGPILTKKIKRFMYESIK